MTRPWEANTSSEFVRRWGKSPQELGTTSGDPNCPDMWELEDGDVAVIGRRATSAYVNGRLPNGVSVADDEEIVIVPRSMLIAAKNDIPDA